MAQRVLAGDSHGQAILIEGGGVTFATVGARDPQRWEPAFVLAAGREGEKLARRFPPPNENPATAPPIASLDLPYALESATTLATYISTVPTDGQKIGCWIVNNFPTNPRRWARVFVQIVKYARACVRSQCEEVVDLARELFMSGHVRMHPPKQSLFSDTTSSRPEPAQSKADTIGQKEVHHE